MKKTSRELVKELECGCAFYEAYEPESGVFPELDYCQFHLRTDKWAVDKSVFYDDEPLSLWFGLSYANFLTLPRLVMESMPQQWQRVMARLLWEVDNTFDWRPENGVYMVAFKGENGRFEELPPLCDYRRGSVESLRIKDEPRFNENTNM